MAKFQSDLLPMQNLDTFVDLSKPLHDLNTLQQKKVRSIIQHLKYQSQTKKILDQQQESKKNLFAISKQLEIELDSLNNLEAQEEQYEVLIDLVQLKYNPKEIGTMIKESSAVIDTHFNLNKIKQHIKSKSHLIQQNEQTNAQQFDLDFIRDINTDSQDFYKEVLQQTKRYSIQKVDEDKLTMNEKLTILKEYLKKKGIEIEKKEKVPHQAYLDFYTEQSNKLIKQTRNSQIQRLNLRKSLSICKNSPSDQSGMSPTLHQIHTNRVSKFGQNQIQLLNSQNITTNQTSTFQTKNRTPQSVKSPTHFKTQSTEKFRDFVAKAQALQSFYNLENKEYYDNINDLDHALKKPMRKHFNEFKLIEQEKEDLQQKEKHNKMVQRKRNNHVKSVRMLKIFKSELS